MKLQKCFFCNKITYTPFHVTEIEEEVTSFDMCKKCAEEYMKDFDSSRKPEQQPQGPQGADLSYIKTPEELLAFLSGAQPKALPAMEPCECGMNLEEFEKFGKLGCVKCYDHFGKIVNPLMLNYHGSLGHVGKQPKQQIKDQMENDPEEKMKLLKLRYAQAIELEKYEDAAVINEEIKALTPSLPSASEDL